MDPCLKVNLWQVYGNLSISLVTSRNVVHAQGVILAILILICRNCDVQCPKYKTSFHRSTTDSGISSFGGKNTLLKVPGDSLLAHWPEFTWRSFLSKFYRLPAFDWRFPHWYLWIVIPWLLSSSRTLLFFLFFLFFSFL